MILTLMTVHCMYTCMLVHAYFGGLSNDNHHLNPRQNFCFVSLGGGWHFICSLVPMPLPDFISEPWRKIGKKILSHSRGEKSPNFSPQLRDKIWEWPGDEATLFAYTLHSQTMYTQFPVSVREVKSQFTELKYLAPI